MQAWIQGCKPQNQLLPSFMNMPELERKKQLISLTPLIDIVFILLVFFMLASTFSQWSYIAVSISEDGETSLSVPQQTLLGVKASTGPLPSFIVEGQAYEQDVLIAKLKQQIADHPEHNVLLLPEPDLALQQLVDGLVYLQNQLGKNVSLAMPQPLTAVQTEQEN